MRGALRGVLLLVVALVSMTAVMAAFGSWRASRQPPLDPSLEGPCQVQATVEPEGAFVDPAASAGVYRIPTSGTVRYRGVLSAGDELGPRPLQGQVVVAMPAPFPALRVARWNEVGSLGEASGTQRYALPDRWAPIGLTATVAAEHREPGLRCAGSLTVRLTGSAFGSWLRPLVVALHVATAWLVARATHPRTRRHDPWLGRFTGSERWTPAGRPGLGLLAGFAHGITAAGVLLLASAVTLSSAWVTALPLLGMVAGSALGWWGPLGGPRGATAPPEEPQRELAVLEPL